MSKEIVAGLVSNNEISTQNPNVPKVTRDERGRVLWKLHGNTPEENEQLGISNVQALFLGTYPEFDERFPRDEEGKISEDAREEAERFIRERIGTVVKFETLSGASPRNRRMAPYFGGSVPKTIATSFNPWCLNFDIEEIKNSNIAEARRRKVQNPEIDIFSQRDGLVQLFNFLTGKANFSQLKPFGLELLGKKPRSGKGFRYAFYLGQINDVEQKTNLYLNPGLDRELADNPPERIYAIPKNLSKGEKEYYWIDFYTKEPNEIDSDSTPATSCRLKPEELQNKIDFAGWHNIGEQLLVDYLQQNNGISFEDIMPFNLKVKHKNFLANYRLACDPKYQIHLEENPKIQVGDQLRFMPHQHKNGQYRWLEISRITDEVDRTPEVVSKFRMLPETGELVGKWIGLERQLLTDHLSKNPNVEFKDLLPIRAKVPAKGEGITLATIDGRQVVFYLPSKTFFPDEEIIFIPKQDDLYQWLELHKTEPETTLEDTISSARIIESGIDQRNWLGPEKQRLRDYSEGKIVFDQLKTVSFVVGDGKGLIHLWRQGNKRVYLVLSQGFNVQKGDNLVLLPKQETDAGATFLLEKEEQILARYKLDIDNGKFTCIDNFVPANETISPDQAREDLWKYLEVEENSS